MLEKIDCLQRVVSKGQGFGVERFSDVVGGAWKVIGKHRSFKLL